MLLAAAPSLSFFFFFHYHSLLLCSFLFFFVLLSAQHAPWQLAWNPQKDRPRSYSLKKITQGRGAILCNPTVSIARCRKAWIGGMTTRRQLRRLRAGCRGRSGLWRKVTGRSLGVLKAKAIALGVLKATTISKRDFLRDLRKTSSFIIR